jgi:cytochrome c oxidase assembly protein subunit 11
VPDRYLALKVAGIAAAMFAFGFALVPIYDVFCELTGFGGKTASAAVAVVEAPDPNRTVRVEFLSSVARGTPFTLTPEVSHMEVHPGQLYETHFRARNLTASSLVAQAVPSVAPATTAKYLQKTECFCFTPQTFAASEQREFTVRFIVAPDLPKQVDRMTLAYAVYTVGSG